MKYEQLTIEKRYQVYAYSKANWSQKDMATELKVHRATIYREKKRNKGQRGYRSQQRCEYGRAKIKIHCCLSSIR